MNGLKFIEKLRSAKSKILKKLPVIMLTRDNDMSLYRSAARLGISAFLVKPVAAANLVEALERALAGGKVAIPHLDKDPAVPPSDAAAEVVIKTCEPEPEAEEKTAAPPPACWPRDFKA